jgi:hypothetical protein
MLKPPSPTKPLISNSASRVPSGRRSPWPERARADDAPACSVRSSSGVEFVMARMLPYLRSVRRASGRTLPGLTRVRWRERSCDLFFFDLNPEIVSFMRRSALHLKPTNPGQTKHEASRHGGLKRSPQASSRLHKPLARKRNPFGRCVGHRHDHDVSLVRQLV